MDSVTASDRPHLLVRLGVVLGAATLIWIGIGNGIGAFFGDAYSDRLGHAVRAVLTAALAVPLVVLARRYLDRRRWAELGLGPLRRDGWRPLLFGAAFWLVAAALGTAVVFGLDWAGPATAAFDVAALLPALYLPVLVLLYEALPEELIFRGYVLRNLADRTPLWAAVTGQALLFTAFGALIGAAGSIERVVLFFTFGLVLGTLRVVTGSLWAPIGFHLTFQWIAQYLAAADRAGALVIAGRAELELVAMWFFPIMLGAAVLAVVAVRRGVRWTRRDPDEQERPASRAA